VALSNCAPHVNSLCVVWDSCKFFLVSPPRNDHSVNVASQDQEFLMIGVGNGHFEERCFRYIVYVNVVPGLEKMNNTYGKTVHVGMMERGFTVLPFCLG
jgi:hypothetical protein